MPMTTSTPFIRVRNQGPLILETNYWDSELAQAGKVFVSLNAGAIRLLVPPAAYGMLADMCAAEECVLSRGPWPREGRAEAIEILFDDRSDSPFSLQLTPESFSGLPGEPPADREWVLSVWIEKDGQPHKEFELVCHWRRVAELPCLRPWKEKTT